MDDFPRVAARKAPCCIHGERKKEDDAKKRTTLQQLDSFNQPVTSTECEREINGFPLLRLRRSSLSKLSL
uniref:Uncharacterized protein n=1 Tax=Kalanchoe fedtschenkoi TaxID=63787 RepID=A0A7N0UI35_KALFE